jgi:thymidylate synthase (FAD)
MRVEYITHMGDDLMVVDAARVSFDKKSEWEAWPAPAPTMEEHQSYACGVAPPKPNLKKLSEKDTKLINYLAKNGHWSPFSHPQIQIRVTAPIFIANQLKRSVVGLSINEVSRRYVDDEPTFYIPEKWRGRPSGSIKQGSSDGEISPPKFMPASLNISYGLFTEIVCRYYKSMIDAGIAPEMARMVLPQSMNTSWIWTGSLLAFIRIYNQRIDSHSQLESQMIAKQLGEILEAHFPVSFKAWTEGFNG